MSSQTKTPNQADLTIEEKLKLVNQAIDNIDGVEVDSVLTKKPLAPVDPASQFICFGCE